MKMKRTKFAFANHSFTKLDQVFLELIFICVQHHLTPVSSNRLFSFLFFFLSQREFTESRKRCVATDKYIKMTRIRTTVNIVSIHSFHLRRYYKVLNSNSNKIVNNNHCCNIVDWLSFIIFSSSRSWKFNASRKINKA